jgi:hypothetical protein
MPSFSILDGRRGPKYPTDVAPPLDGANGALRPSARYWTSGGEAAALDALFGQQSAVT